MKKLLVIADLEEQKPCSLIRALELAKHAGAAVHVVAFAYENLVEIPDLVDQKLLEKVKKIAIQEKREWLERCIAEHNEAGVKVSSEVVWEHHIHEWVAAHVDSEHFAMVLKTGHRSEEAFYTPTDWQLMRVSPVPVMIVTHQKWRKKANVLAVVDLATRSRNKKQLNFKIMDEASRLAKDCDARLHCCYAITVPAMLTDLDLINKEEYTARAREKIAPQLQKLCENYGLDEDQVHVVTGEPSRMIPKVANQLKADLVVIGYSGRKGLKRGIMGNTAEKILGRIRTDVVTVKL